MNVYADIFIYGVYVHIYACEYSYAHMYVCMYVCVCVCTYVSTCTFQNWVAFLSGVNSKQSMCLVESSTDLLYHPNNNYATIVCRVTVCVLQRGFLATVSCRFDVKGKITLN